MIGYSILRETAVKQSDAMVLSCPQCEPTRILQIEEVYRMGIVGSSIITYKCQHCQYKDDVLVEYEP